MPVLSIFIHIQMNIRHAESNIGNEKSFLTFQYANVANGGKWHGKGTPTTVGDVGATLQSGCLVDSQIRLLLCVHLLFFTNASILFFVHLLFFTNASIASLTAFKYFTQLHVIGALQNGKTKNRSAGPIRDQRSGLFWVSPNWRFTNTPATLPPKSSHPEKWFKMFFWAILFISILASQANGQVRRVGQVY